MKTNQAIEVRTEVTPNNYKWIPAQFVSRHGHKVTVKREGLVCDAGGTNPRAHTFTEVYTASNVREAAINDRFETEKDMLCDFLMVNFDKAKAYKLALELLPFEALTQLKKATRS